MRFCTLLRLFAIAVAALLGRMAEASDSWSAVDNFATAQNTDVTNWSCRCVTDVIGYGNCVPGFLLASEHSIEIGRKITGLEYCWVWASIHRFGVALTLAVVVLLVLLFLEYGFPGFVNTPVVLIQSLVAGAIAIGVFGSYSIISDANDNVRRGFEWNRRLGTDSDGDVWSMRVVNNELHVGILRVAATSFLGGFAFYGAVVGIGKGLLRLDKRLDEQRLQRARDLAIQEGRQPLAEIEDTQVRREAEHLLNRASKAEISGKYEDAQHLYAEVVMRFEGTTASEDAQRQIDILRSEGKIRDS